MAFVGARKVELLRVVIVIDVLFSCLDRAIALEEVTRVRQWELDDLIRLAAANIIDLVQGGAPGVVFVSNATGGLGASACGLS